MVRLAGAVVAVLLLALPSAASAAVTVNTTADHVPDTCDPVGPGTDCTLREAINNPPLDGEIIVPAGTYGLIQGELDVDADMTIRGAGARTTIIRPGPDIVSRVMTVESGLDSVTISGVTITGGDADGGQGGGINNGLGTPLDIIDSAIVDNTADSGAGIMDSGVLTITRSLIARNHAVGAASPAFGGGIFIVGGTSATVIENTTIARNTATNGSIGSGGGIYTRGNLDLINVTLAENIAPSGGGLFEDFGGDSRSTFTVNTLAARNAGGNCGGTALDPIESTNGLSDELAAPTCNTNPPGPPNLLVADTKLGPLANNGGPTDTMKLLEGSPGIDAGEASPCPSPDQRGVPRPQRNACDIGAYEAEPVQSQPPQGGGGTQELPPPVVGKKVNALPESGTVKIKLPGSNKFVVLTEDTQIPVGTDVDTRKGRITLVAAANKSGGTATADFYNGLFRLTQTKGKKPITVLTLIEKLTGCKAKGKASIAKKKKVKKRRLWGDGKGRFQTKGKRSAATVVGTKWLVEDRCTTTLTKVARGKVSVRDFIKKKTVLVKAGKRYIARDKP